jgi:hypothetical protein
MSTVNLPNEGHTLYVGQDYKPGTRLRTEYKEL